ncbi:MAG: hypothetical protein UX73_C0016G0003 [candidate division WWE3 bacterium GW2011_GWC1_47_10]|uniref:Uncharacterized protein n=1 Tax=candidate division WWE3 bacterium GW2011_GWC1_47_10 TaxID=1619122 RepID=A0A0G1R0N3_UNCKA|nr:MAG: hypothetical protein UX73_C0016G0003 [candidate division WWE3 bacterium GW2011_GWC1_47_10]
MSEIKFPIFTTSQLRRLSETVSNVGVGFFGAIAYPILIGERLPLQVSTFGVSVSFLLISLSILLEGRAR